MCKNLHTGLGHDECMLPLSRWLLVASDNFPSVWVVGIDKHLPCTHVDHRLNGEHHTRYQKHACALVSIVQHLGLLVELKSHAMSAEIAHYTISIFLAMILDGMTDVAHKTVRLSHLHTFATRTNCSFSGVVFPPTINIRLASA